MISFSSSIKSLQKLKSEVCRMPIKPNSNGQIELYTKDAMKTKFKVASPNLADSVMQTMRFIPAYRAQTVLPQPMRVMGRR
jgi:phage terminase large subunit